MDQHTPEFEKETKVPTNGELARLRRVMREEVSVYMRFVVLYGELARSERVNAHVPAHD